MSNEPVTFDSIRKRMAQLPPMPDAILVGPNGFRAYSYNLRELLELAYDANGEPLMIEPVYGIPVFLSTAMTSERVILITDRSIIVAEAAKS